ncbi:MAG: outer-membrane lipoprotein carrier protein LolA [Candidatus Cloacimonetes bacterium]|nr:outer-membrane lipoprotein carrier protein LolA [Candidatus Cloacimonadota bacterium]
MYEDILITYSKIYTYEASFAQENYWNEIDIYKNSDGKVFYNREKLLMKYSQPDGQILFIADFTVTMYDPINNQAIISDKTDIELRPDKLIAKYWDISEKEIIDQFDNSVKIELHTRNAEKIQITVTNNLITEFYIVDENDNVVMYQFADVQVNKELPDKIFDVKLPENINLIDLREK